MDCKTINNEKENKNNLIFLDLDVGDVFFLKEDTLKLYPRIKIEEIEETDGVMPINAICLTDGDKEYYLYDTVVGVYEDEVIFNANSIRYEKK